MLKKILFALVFTIGTIALIIARQPDTFHIERSILMNASDATIFAEVNDLHRWENWSPWAKLDPKAKTTFEGPDYGTGATMRWAGNEKVGEGSMTITESKRHERIAFKLEFLKPFPGTNDAAFTFTPEGDHTRVTWSMSGQNNFIAKAINLIIDCDKMVGEQFELGLESLKQIAEKKR